MGIELPEELADVAAETGLSWPQADEDKMREQAGVWRDAQQKLNALAADADTTAGGAVGAMSGTAGETAGKLWSGFVDPDHGHLTVAARGAGQAADRLEHAADQVGAAKVEMVRQLVDTAKNRDAAHAAADAGHPTALLGLDSTLRGASANLTAVTNGLAGAVGPEGGPPVSAVTEVVDPNPGTRTEHGQTGLLGAVTGVPQHILSTVDVPNVADSTVDGVDQVVEHGGQVAPEPADMDTGQIPVQGHPGPPGASPDAGTGPIQVAHPVSAHYGGFLDSGGFDDVPTPAAGVPLVPGGTSAAGFTDAALAGRPPAAGAPGIAPPAGALGPAVGGQPLAGPPAGYAPPPFAGGVPGAAPIGGGVPGVAGPGVAPRQAAGPGVFRFAPQAEPPTYAVPRDVPRSDVSPPVPRQPPVGAPRQERESIIALFLVHMFPIGHLPVASERPARQLPPPPADVDYAAGLRFPPHDHPRSDLIDSSDALATVRAGWRRLATPPASPPSELTEGYDPLGGMHERDWDRRFLAGMRGSVPEYAWPPGELYPEGGCEAGEAELLPAGTLLDRFGDISGRVFAPQATPFANRSLPPVSLEAGYRHYRVLREVPMWRALAAGWFGQRGGGVRYRALYSADELVTLGYLADVTFQEEQ